MLRAYSISQIQFDCLSYIKEFGARPAEWVVGTCDDPDDQLRDATDTPWLTRPALTAKAARAVVDRLCQYYGVVRGDDRDGRYVVLTRADESRGYARIAI